MMWSIISVILTLFVCSNSVYEAVANGNDYEMWCIGQCESDFTPVSTTPGVVLMGGGTDTDEAFVWQIEHANGGDFVVIRTSGDDAYNPYIYALSVLSKSTLNSVTTILFKTKKASQEPEVLTRLRNAEAIFMAGGDQSEYVNYWRNTEVQSIMQDKAANITIGGTSAGCAVLGHWVYSAQYGSLTSEEALANPYHKFMTIEPAFLKFPYLETFITDTHFVTRDRMGRSITFLARIMKDVDATPPTLARSVGIDEHTALLLDVSTGAVQAVGVGTAYVCTAEHAAETCEDRTALTYHNVACTRLSAENKDKYSFASFSGDGVQYVSNVDSAVFEASPYGPSEQKK